MTLLDLSPVTKVAGFYIGLCVSVCLSCTKKHRFASLVVLSVLFACLNFGYYPTRDGVARSTAMAIAIYDPLFNHFGLTQDFSGMPGLSECINGTKCSALEDYFTHHVTFAVGFFNRYMRQDDQEYTRRFNLIGHIWPSTVGMLLSLFQLNASFRKKNLQLHRYTGRLIVLLLTYGTIKALQLTSDRRPDAHGNLGTIGWYWMAALMLGCLYKGVIAARNGDIAEHELWMIRFYGALFGSFFLFRLLFLAIIGPLVRWTQSANLIIFTVWSATPMGLLLAELLFARKKKPTETMKKAQ